jgi:hypothetical protein
MSFINKFAVTLLLVTLAGTAAFGKPKSKQVEFQKAVTVNGTLVKAGTYKLTFDEMANELAILKKDKIVAKSTAHLEPRTRKAQGTQLYYREEGGDTALVGVTFGGDQDIVLGQAGMQATGNN